MNKIIHILKVIFISVFFTFTLNAYYDITSFKKLPGESVIIILVLSAVFFLIFIRVWANFENSDITLIKVLFAKLSSLIVCFSIVLIFNIDVNYFPNDFQKKYLLISENMYGENEDGDELNHHGYGYMFKIDKLQDTITLFNDNFLVYSNKKPKVFFKNLDENFLENNTEAYLINYSITKEYGLFLGYKFDLKENSKWYQYLYYTIYYLFEFLLNNWFSLLFSIFIYVCEDKINLLENIGVFKNLKRQSLFKNKLEKRIKEIENENKYKIN